MLVGRRRAGDDADMLVLEAGILELLDAVEPGSRA